MNDGTLSSSSFRLSWGECDPAGIVYYAAYFPWMERLHSEWWLGQELRFDRMLDLIGAMPVTRATRCDYLAPARVLDPITLTMRAGHLGRTSFVMAFEAVDHLDPAQPVRVATAELHLVFVDRSGRPAAIPDPARRCLEVAAGDERSP